MPFVPTANVALVELIYRWDSQVVENTLYFQNAGSFDGEDMAALAGVLAEWAEDSLLPRMSSDIRLTQVKVTDQTAADAATYTLPVVPELPGAVASDSMPNNVALTVSFRTAGRGRSARGRNYVPGLPEGSAEGSFFSLALVEELTSAYNAIPTVLPINWTWVVVSKALNGVPRVAGLAQPVTSAVVVDNVADSQRRRLPGRGR